MNHRYTMWAAIARTRGYLWPVILATIALPDHGVRAQAFPAKTVRIIVPTTPGGSIDILTRLVAQKLGESWRQGIVVENRPGAGGVIGADLVAKAPPDGYTLAFMAAQFTITAAVSSRLPYDALRDFAPVMLLANVAWALAANPSLPVHTVKELIVLAKKRPGQINYASSGSGGATHLAAELFNSMAGTRMNHVPYKGTLPAVNDVVGGHLELTIAGLSSVMPHAATGRLRMIGIVGSKRTAVMPQVPTIGETLPGYEYNAWFGVLAPRATPPEIVAQLHDHIARALQAREVSQPLLAQSIEPAIIGAAQFGELIRSEIAKYGKLARDIGISVD